MLRIFNKENSIPQKKLLSFQNAKVMDQLIKAEASYYSTSDSLVVEKALDDHFLNSDDETASATALYLFEKNGIVTSARKLLQIFIRHPEFADDTLLHLLQFLSRMALEYESLLPGAADKTGKIAEYAALFHHEIEKTIDLYPTYQFYTADGHRTTFANRAEVNALYRGITEAIASPADPQTRNLPYLVISFILHFWNFGGGLNSTTLKNWKVTYLLLEQALGVCEWPDHLSIKFEYSRLVREITLNKADGEAYSQEASVLSKKIYLRRKIFCTTEDAVILHSEEMKEDEYFTNARRITHGPGHSFTRKPYIFLFQNESDQQIEKIVESLLVNYPDEFPDTRDAYTMPFMYNGIYYDKRMRWITA